MKNDTRIICSKCGACASHEIDRVNGKCHFCGASETTVQERNETGAWVNKVVLPQWKATILSNEQGVISDQTGKNIAVVFGQEHLQILASAFEMKSALEAIFKHCSMVHNQWGDGCNIQQADEAVKAAKLALEHANVK